MAAGMNNNINSVKFDVTLDLQEFKELLTDTFYVRGNPWLFEFEKSDPVEGISFLSGYLQSKMNILTFKDAAVVGSCTVEIHSNKFDGKSHVKRLEPFSFEPEECRGFPKWIRWDVLTDPENGYVYNGKCKISVNVKASPLLLPNDGKWLEILPITKFKDCCSKGKFQIKIKKVFDFVDTCTPRFTFKHIPWRLIVFKHVITTENDKNDDILGITLHSYAMSDESEETYKVSMTCELISSDPTIAPLLKKFENEEFEGSSYHSFDMLSWNELIDPQKKFVQNDSFILKFKFEVKDDDDDEEGEALEDDEPKAIKLECPICFESLVDQPLSVLICAHLFCTNCITESLEKKRNCPTCDREIPEGELQKVYLPTK